MKVTNIEELKRERKKAAYRKRRIIFNNDGNEPVKSLTKATAKGLLNCRTTPLLGTQVDSIFYCTWGTGFCLFTHNTKVGEIFDTTANPRHPKNKWGGYSRNKTADFIKQGTDPLKIMVEFCKKNKIEVFWSMRMNDTHDAFTDCWWGPLVISKLKKDHPEWLVGSETKRPKYGRWSAVDYGRQEIRDLAFQYIQEVCENYDVDGVELDFFRTPLFFRSQAMGQDVGQEERGMMTSMIRRIRKMTERVGIKRGRPILVAVRVPDSVGHCAAIGLDIIPWMEEDLIDILVVSGWYRLNPWQVSVQLAHKYDVAVYPCLSAARVWVKDKRILCDRYRANAMNVWDSGADGVYTFNYFISRSPLWRELGDPKTLETMDKLYCRDGMNPVGSYYKCINKWLANGERFVNRQLLSACLPLALKSGEAATVELRVGQHVRESKSKGLVPEVTLRLRVKGLPDAADLSVKLNDKPLSGGVKSEWWVEYSVNPGFVRKGVNRFEILLQPGSTAKPVLQDLQLWVRYKKKDT